MLFIPEFVEYATQAFKKGNFIGHLVKDGIFLVTLLQLVVGNLRAEVMDVMKADVAREPLQHFGEFIE